MLHVFQRYEWFAHLYNSQVWIQVRATLDRAELSLLSLCCSTIHWQVLLISSSLSCLKGVVWDKFEEKVSISDVTPGFNSAVVELSVALSQTKPEDWRVMILHPLLFTFFSVLVQAFNLVVVFHATFDCCHPDPECTMTCIFSLREPPCYYIFWIALISIIVDVTALVLEVYPQFNESLLDVACLGTQQHHQHPRALGLQILNIWSV